jgi:signal transduction histidine kinase
LLSASVDLPYFKVFSHSIMRELSRLDALALNQAKTTFVASISHELRSPLHGILGTLEFIKDTPLDSFQTSMLNSLNACGQTLLDTINHVMDHAKISEATRNVSTRRLKSTHTVRISSKPLKSRRSRAGAFDLGIATEEVVEAVFSGASYVPISGAMMDAPNSPSESGSDPMTKRKTCYVVLDLAHEDDWVYCFPVGSWRRIVMNIFGNAVKYTESGHIHVSLRVNDGARVTNAPTTVSLTITDSGKGMSPQFLADKAFQPFSQENPVRDPDILILVYMYANLA